MIGATTDPEHAGPDGRRRVQDDSRLPLSVRLWWHPYWDTARSVPAAHTELRRLARTWGAARHEPRLGVQVVPAAGKGALRCQESRSAG
ncbi:hypothetical protein D9753_00890 [Streptomyces dangxiongensis]|uniref:Uncharacterized protein n=1 Tax=Streptomyces dangxiongensis TaxID=1442032 RepID=A0A3G2J6F3_9ACTN|nr:hypothetical protein D9753_00890 [Streptomyces dangxiongensis]